MQALAMDLLERRRQLAGLNKKQVIQRLVQMQLAEAVLMELVITKLQQVDSFLRGQLLKDASLIFKQHNSRCKKHKSDQMQGIAILHALWLATLLCAIDLTVGKPEAY